MPNYLSKNIIFGLLVFINIHTLKAQTEYIVTVNPSNGFITKIDSIPEVTWLKGFYIPTYCENNQQYTFIGGDDPSGDPFYLFTIDAVSGNILSKPLFVNHNNFLSLHYSQSGDILYGIVNNSSNVSLVSVNTTNASYSTIRTIPGLFSVLSLIVDDLHDRFIILGPDNIGNLVILTMNISTGNIISHAITNRINNLLYNRSTDKFYAIANRTGVQPNQPVVYSLCTVDPYTGTTSNLSDIPNLAGFSSGYETLDENNNIYFLAGFEWGDTANFLYSIDLINGNVIHKPRINMGGVTSQDNLIEFRYDNNVDILYALYWESKTMTSADTSSACVLNIQTKVYPNPFVDVLIVDKNPTICEVKMNLYNSVGQLILKSKPIHDGRNEISLSNLPSGKYFYKFISKSNILLTGQVLKL